MTFAVIEVGVGTEKVVGTIWANAETEAHTIMTDLLNAPQTDKIVIRRAEDREIPLKPFD